MNNTMKYKLINTTTKTEHLCDKVVIDGFDYYVSDEKSLSNNGDWYLGYPNYDTLFKWEMTGIHEGKQVWINKVIATNNPSFDIPQVVDEVKIVSKEHFQHKIVGSTWYEVFEEGYNKSQETHPFSEEDMIEFAHFYFREEFNSTMQNCKSSEEIFQVWKEQKSKIVYYE